MRLQAAVFRHRNMPWKSGPSGPRTREKN